MADELLTISADTKALMVFAVLSGERNAFRVAGDSWQEDGFQWIGERLSADKFGFYQATTWETPPGVPMRRFCLIVGEAGDYDAKLELVFSIIGGSDVFLDWVSTWTILLEVRIPSRERRTISCEQGKRWSV